MSSISAAQPTAIHTALSQALEGVRSAGQFQTLVLADARGLAWAVAGEVAAPDQIAAVPALLTRAFTDRQMLLRFFSEKSMRFEYRSDTLAWVKARLTQAEAGPEYLLDVPNDKATKDAREFQVSWDDGFLALRTFPVRGEDWCLLGVSPNVNSARAALQKGAPTVAGLLNGFAGDARSASGAGHDDPALHARMTAELSSFRAAAPEIYLAAVTSKDGFVVAALEDATVEAEMVAPLVGHSFLAIQESTQRLCGETECVMLRMEQGILLARELTSDLLFAALLAPSACTGLILTAFETAAVGLRAALQAGFSPTPSSPTPQSVEVSA